MKIAKSLTGAFLAICLVLSMTCTAFAADITIENTTAGHTYTAYQIFTGDLLQGDGNQDLMTAIDWGNDVTTEGQNALYTEFGAANAGELATKLIEASEGTGRDVAREVADLLVRNDGYLATGVTAEYADGQYRFEELADGYYLITDQADSDVLSAYMVKVVGEDIPISPKVGTPTLEKKVEDVNDSVAADGVLQDSADYDIGDDVPFTITITLPENYESYAGYYMAVTDTMSEGLELDPYSIQIMLPKDDTPVEYGDILSSDAYAFSTGSDGFKLAIIDLKKVDAKAQNGDKVVITYSATLTDNAAIGDDGNSNTAHLTYQRDPNFTGDIIPGEYGESDKIDSDGDGTTDEEDSDDDNDGTPDDDDNDDDGDGIPDDEEKDSDGDGIPDSADPDEEDSDDVTGNTPEDQVVVYTFQLHINKVDSNTQPLQGAKFSLYKCDKDGIYSLVEEKTGAGEHGSTFDFVGLDDGKYRLEEIAPEGYNPIEPIEFEIEAEHITLPDSTITLDGVSITVTSSGDLIEGDKEKGVINMEVVNYKGAVLPETGGMGTTIFYIVGGVLVLGAGVLLVTKRRVDKNK